MLDIGGGSTVKETVVRFSSSEVTMTDSVGTQPTPLPPRKHYF